MAQVTFAGTTPVALGSDFNGPFSTAVDAAGDLFVADYYNNAVKEIVAVNGSIPVTNPTILTLGSGFNGPVGVAVDASGDVFVADDNDRTLSEIVAVNGSIPANNPTIRVLGGGFGRLGGVGVDAAGDVFVADFTNNVVDELVAVGGSVPATNLTVLSVGGFSQPLGLALDAAGNVFVADSLNNAIREIVTVDGNLPATNPTILTLGSGFNQPYGVAVDAVGDVFVADTNNAAVKEIVAVNGSIPATNPTILTLGSGFEGPQGVTADAAGNVFVADFSGNAVKEIQLNSVNFSGINVCPATVGAPAPCTETLTLNFNFPAGIGLQDPIVTTGGAQGLDFTVAPNSTCGTEGAGIPCTVNVTFAPSASGVRAGAVTVTEAGECARFPCDLPHATVLIFGTGLAPQAALFGIEYEFQPTTASTAITGMAVDGAGNYYYSDQTGQKVYEVVNFGAATPVGFTGLIAPQQLAIDGSGAVYVMDGGSQIIKLAANGVQSTVLTTLTAGPPDLQTYLANIAAFTLDGEGNVYVGGPIAECVAPCTSPTAGTVVKLDVHGNLTQIATGLASLYALQVGPGGTIYALDFSTNTGFSTVTAITPAGQSNTVATNLPSSTAMAVDAGGTIYLAEDALPPYSGAPLLAIDSTGVQSNPIYMTGVDTPEQMAITPLGALYIANETGSQTGNPSGNIFIDSRSVGLNGGPQGGGFDFTDELVGTTSPGFTEPVFNIGNEPLTIFGLSYVGPFSELPVANSSPTECGATLGAGTGCVVTDVFSPTVAGPVMGSFMLTDNSLNTTANNPATQTYDLYGTGVLPAVAMSLTGPANPPVFGGFPGVYTVIESDVTGAPAQGDYNVVDFVVTGPEQFDYLSTTLSNGTGTLTLTLNEPGTYTMVATDPTNGLTATDSNFVISSTGPGLNYATIGLALSSATPYYSDNPILTVTVTGANTPPPTGTISYSVDNGAAVTANLSSPIAGPTSVSIPLGQLAVGAHSVSVTYSGGGANNFYLQSGPEVLNFNVADPPLSLVSSERLQAFANAGTPDGVAMDANGNVYLADSAGGRVLEYLAAQPNAAPTVLITGLSKPNGLSFAPDGRLYITDSGTNQLIGYDPGGPPTPIGPLGLNNPGKVAAGPIGIVYIADTGNNRVVLLNNGVQSTVPAVGLNAPQGVAVDAAGNLYIADTGNSRVLKIDTNQNQTTILSTPDPIAVTVDANTNVYVLDGNGSDTVTRIDALGHQVQLNGVGSFNGFNLFPADIAADTLGNLLVPGTQPVTPGNQTSADLLVISTNPGIKVQDVPVGGPSETGAANYLVPSAFGVAPAYAATDLAGNGEFAGNQLFNCTNGIATSGICTYTISFNPILPGVRSGSFTLSLNGDPLRTDAVFGNGLAPLVVFEQGVLDPEVNVTGLSNPVGIAVDSLGQLYVADAGNGSIFKIPVGGAPTAILTGLVTPAGVAVDGAGNVYATDNDDNFIKKIDVQGNVTSVVTNLDVPAALAIDGAGNLYVLTSGYQQTGNSQVIKVDPSGNETTVYGPISQPTGGLAVDSQGNVYVGVGGGIIAKIAPSGAATNIVVGFTPGAIAIDAAGEVYVINSETNNLTRIDADGNQTSPLGVAGTFSGVALDGAGNIYYLFEGAGNVPDIGEFNRSMSIVLPFQVAVGSQGLSQSLLTNIGNQPLIFSGIVATDPFGVSTTAFVEAPNCSTATPVAAGTDCGIIPSFTPTAVGLVNGTATLTDNSLNNTASTQAIVLQGTGTGINPVSIAVTGPLTGVGGAISGTYTITELGAGGVAATGDSDVVLIKSALAGPIPGPSLDVTLTNGVGTFTIQYPTVTTGPVAFTIGALDATNDLAENIVVQLSPPQQPTTLTLAASPAGSSFFGQRVTLTATLASEVSVATATGTVTFANNGVALPGGTVALVNGVAQFTTNQLPVSADSLSATYSGDVDFAPSPSNTVGYSVFQPATTTTTLAVSSGGNAVTTVASGTAVTLTASVVEEQSPYAFALSPGLVTFCDATALHCDNSALLGTAQLTTAGIAVLRIVPGIGAHSYKAVFAGTIGDAGSTSAAAPLTVTGLYPTTTTIQATGAAGSYTLMATTVGNVSSAVGAAGPTGTISFQNTTHGSLDVATAALGPGTLAQTFARPAPYQTGSESYVVAVGDFNGDGLPDLVVVNLFSNNVSVLLGVGNGTFQAQVAYATGRSPESVATGDFNGDGFLDLAVANTGDNTVSILIGKGDGTFDAQATYATGNGPASVAVGDFNHDGVLDLAVANMNDNTVSILIGNGDGSFQTELAYATGADPDSVAVGDFNGDGALDLAVANYGGSRGNTVSVLLGNGDGSFQTQVPYTTGGAPQSIAIGDFNGDGVPDLAVANSNVNTVSVLIGKGDGTFQAQVAYAGFEGPVSVAVGDFNADGFADLAVANAANYVSVSPGKGDGTFNPPVDYAPGGNPLSVAVGDFNGDGVADLAVANFTEGGYIEILLNQLTETATATATGISIPGAGTQNVDAFYPGDANFGRSTSQTTGLTGTPVATTLVLAVAPPSPQVFGQTIGLSATLSPDTFYDTTNGGEAIQFYDGNTLIRNGLLGAGQAQIGGVTLAVGQHTLTAVYAGDNIFATTTSNAITYTIIQPALVFTTPPLGFVASGGNGGIVVVTQENAGVTLTAPAVPVTLTVTGPNGYSQVYGPITTVNGVASFNTGVNALVASGTYTYTATSATATTAVAMQTVVPASFNLAPNGQSVGTATAVQTVTVVFNAGATLAQGANAIQVVTQGLQNLDFTLAPNQGAGACAAGTAYTAGQSCTAAVIFTPKAPGLRLGAVLLYGTVAGSDTTVVATAALLSGVGNGALVDFSGSTPTTLVTSPAVSAPEGVAVDAAGDVFVADSPNQALVELPAGGGAPTTLSVTGPGSPIALAIDGAGNLYVVDQGETVSFVVEFPAGGGAQKTVFTTEGVLSGIAVDAGGNLYVSNQTLDSVDEISVGGTEQTLIGEDSGLTAPQGLALDASGDLFIADSGSKRIMELPAGGNDLVPVVTGLANSPNAVAVDAGGNLYIAESQGNVVLEVNSAGVTQAAFTQGIGAPLGVALDGLGNLYVASPNTFSAVEFMRSIPPDLTFAAQAAGTASAPQAVTVQNSGNQPLIFSAIAPGTNTALDADSTTCRTGVNVAAGAACNLGVEFAPPATAAFATPLIGKVSLTDNAQTTPQVISFTGAVQPGVAVAQSSITTGGSIPYGPYSVTVMLLGQGQAVPIPTGSIFYVLDNGANVPVPGTLTNGSIVFPLPQIAVGNHTIGFGYSGDAHYAGTPNNIVPAARYVPFTVTPAVLTVTANSPTIAFGQPLPALTDAITGFVFNDTVASAVTGAPLLTTTATTTSAPGNYTIAVAQGTLAATNYTFTFVPGTLSITQAAETIVFAPIASQSYGAAAFSVTATASSGLPVTIAVQSGPATIAGNLVTITGVGTVTLVATQAGNADYSAAQPVVTSFAVAPASTSLAVSASSSVVRTPSPVTLTATLSSPASGATGTVTFLDGATALGQSPLTSSETAVLSGVALAVGSHTITASYSGTADFAASASTATTVVVEAPAVVLTTIAPTVVAAGSADTTITATGADFSPTAVVTFNSTPLATTFVSATQLTAVIPAALLATAGSATVTVTDTYSVSASQPQTFTVLPVAPVTFNGPPTSNPDEQPTLNFTLQQAYAVALNGTMTLTFTPDPGNPDNPQVQFATGGRTFNFTLPPNTTDTPLILVQAGTTSGTISISLQLTASGVNVTPPALAPIAIVVPKVAPTISSLSFTTSGNTLTVSVTGFSSTREIQSATFNFTPAAGATLATKTITVSATTLFTTWYTNADSAQFGSEFTYTQIFTLSGNASAVAGVGVTLTNQIGTSTEATSP